jgi:hypothetical protein
VDLTPLSARANPAGVPTAPAHARETLKVGCDGPLSPPLVGSDASLRFNDLSLEIGYGFLRLAARACGLANRRPSGFQGLNGITVLLELDPMPSDVAIAVGNHVAAAVIDLSTLLGTSISTSSAMVVDSASLCEELKLGGLG